MKLGWFLLERIFLQRKLSSSFVFFILMSCFSGCSFSLFLCAFEAGLKKGAVQEGLQSACRAGHTPSNASSHWITSLLEPLLMHLLSWYYSLSNTCLRQDTYNHAH